MLADQTFFVSTIPGLENAAHLELCERWAESLAYFPLLQTLPQVNFFKAGFEFQTSVEHMAFLLPRLRVSQRVLMRVGSFMATSSEELIEGLSLLPWQSLVPARAEVALNFSSRSSRISIERQVETALVKVLKGQKARLSKEGLGIFIRFFRDECTVSLDLSGPDSFRRQDGRQGSVASLRSSTAAGLLRILLQGVRQPIHLIDPMCGSGTFLLEAAQWNQPLTRDLGINKIPTFKAQAHFDIESRSKMSDPSQIQIEADKINLLHNISGFDNHNKAVRVAQDNFKKLHLEKVRVALADLYDPAQGTDFDQSLDRIVVLNPPWGKRLAPASRDLLEVVMEKYQPKRVGLLMPSHWRVNIKGLEKVRDIPLLNSGVENRFLVFA